MRPGRGVGAAARPARAAAARGSLALLLGLAGCAQTIALQPPSEPLDFGYRGGDGRRVRVASPFADERPRQGCAFMELPGRRERRPPPKEALKCSEDPLRWFADQLAAALRTAGYTVVDARVEDGDEILEIRGALQTLDARSVSAMNAGRFEADVGAELRVSSPSGLDARRRFYAKVSRPRLFGGAATSQQVLDEAAARTLRDMTAAILSLTNRYPGVGVASAAP